MNPIELIGGLNINQCLGLVQQIYYCNFLSLLVAVLFFF